jgi:glutathione S-transferase
MKDKITNSMEILDGFLSTSLWFADNENATIADLSILANVSQIKACGYEISKHQNLSRWYEQCRSLPGFEENENGAIELGKIFESQLGKQF